LREVRGKHESAIDGGDYDDIQELSRQQADLEGKLDALRNNWDRATSPTVGPEDIAELVAMWTGVPVMQLAQEESERLLQMESELRKAIVGQEEAVQTISKAVRRARAGLKDPRRPIGSFIFLGPTGVGKTELTKALATFMFGTEDALIQIDMSEFMERHNVSRLVGAPPGYVGYEESGQLTEAIRRKPYSIVVFDEIEKAHPEAHNMLLQIMEEGHLSDARGRKVDFRNAMIIMTSNVGADMIKRQTSFGFQVQQDEELTEKLAYSDMQKKLNTALKRAFRPEFINRVDSTIIFRSLSKEDLHEIVSLELDKVAGRLTEYEIVLDATPDAIDKLSELGYDPEFGARPLRRVIQAKVEDPLSDGLLSGKFQQKSTIMADVETIKDEFGDDIDDIVLRTESVSTDEPEVAAAA
jgi:ATP-dependent Clp protease ATP-binding subunit ClpC